MEKKTTATNNSSIHVNINIDIQKKTYKYD